MIKAQNLTIENALRQSKDQSQRIGELAEQHRDKNTGEKNKLRAIEDEIATLEESIDKLKREADDLTQEYEHSAQREQMFRQQYEDLKRYNEETNVRFRQAKVDNKLVDGRLRKEVNESARLKDELNKGTRTGRQPSLCGESKEAKKKREDRVSGRSFGENSYGESDTSSYISANNKMVIPEDDESPEPCFGGQASPQTTMDKSDIENMNITGYTSTNLKEHLSVIISEENS